MNRALKILAIFLGLIAGAFLLGIISFFVFHKTPGLSFKGDIAVIEVQGGIYSADEIVEELDDARKDRSIRAVVIRIDSPGGSVAASQEISSAVKELAKVKPTVASMGNIATSGAYYVAIGASKIVANPGTITGSIGVRLEHINLKELLSWAKIGHETLKSGEYKDLLPFDKPIGPKERELLMGVLKDMHQQFKEAVSEARGLAMADVDKLADGRIFSGREALEKGLVDALGGMKQAVDIAKEMAGIKGEPNIVRLKPERPWWMKMVLEEVSSLLRGVRGMMY